MSLQLLIIKTLFSSREMAIVYDARRQTRRELAYFIDKFRFYSPTDLNYC